MTAKKTAAAEQSANPTPAAPGTSTEQSAGQDSTTEQAGETPDTRTEREKQLEAENEQLSTELDAEISAHNCTIAERDEYRGQMEQHVAGTILSTDEDAAEADATEPSEEDAIREILTRNGLKKAWMLDSGPCFDEKHAKHVAGPDFDALAVITAG